MFLPRTLQLLYFPIFIFIVRIQLSYNAFLFTHARSSTSDWHRHQSSQLDSFSLSIASLPFSSWQLYSSLLINRTVPPPLVSHVATLVTPTFGLPGCHIGDPRLNGQGTDDASGRLRRLATPDITSRCSVLFSFYLFPRVLGHVDPLDRPLLDNGLCSTSLGLDFLQPATRPAPLSSLLQLQPQQLARPRLSSARAALARPRLFSASAAVARPRLLSASAALARPRLSSASTALARPRLSSASTALARPRLSSAASLFGLSSTRPATSLFGLSSTRPTTSSPSATARRPFAVSPRSSLQRPSFS